MPRKGHSEDQIIRALRQVEAGKKVGDVCREMGVLQQAFYSWKRKYAGAGPKRAARAATTARRESKGEDAGRRPDTRQAYLAGGALKKSLKPGAPSIRERHLARAQIEREACLRADRDYAVDQRYQSRRDPQSELRMRLRDLAESRISYEYRRLTVPLRREEWAVNAKRVYRLYREESLQVRTAKHAKEPRTPGFHCLSRFEQTSGGAWIFVGDRFSDGRWFASSRWWTSTRRECLCTYAERSQTGEKVVEQMKRLVTRERAPESITTDNGSEFAGQAMDAWGHQAGVKLDFISQAVPFRAVISRASTGVPGMNA